MSFVATDYNLPLFLASRNRLKYNQPGIVRDHIAKYRFLLARHCNEENSKETATRKFQKHLIGLDVRPQQKCATPRQLKRSRDLITHRSWHLPPNRYYVPTQLFESRKGLGGAFWQKLRKMKVLKTSKQSSEQQNIKRRESNFTEQIPDYRRIRGGKFLSNARDRPPTLRLMLFDARACNRNAKEPGPSEYYPRNHEISYRVSPKLKTKRVSPYLFLRNSIVPETVNSIHKRHSSFEPGPGRYETRFRPECPCPANLINLPGIRLIVEREKRLKFRRLGYQKIIERFYYSPDWRHVEGHGFKSRFITKTAIQKTGLKLDTKLDEKQKKKNHALYADTQYINMIVNPSHAPISTREEPIKQKSEIDIHYNCTEKQYLLRQNLPSKKGIGFSTAQKRFEWQVRPRPLTVTQMEKIKQSLPEERRLRNQPIMRTSASRIESKLSTVPKHMALHYELPIRKPLYKFLPLPGIKLLVTEKDMRRKGVGSIYVPPPLFEKPIKVEDYFKPEALKKSDINSLQG